ncbi:hypothetical protein TNCV_2131891 [Trichonephila clavipes]|nr:hypothetical protein TNCV_2131891 [Trichonephila clavipes]
MSLYPTLKTSTPYLREDSLSLDEFNEHQTLYTHSREAILNFASKLGSEDGSKKRKTTREANDAVLDRALYLRFSQRRIKADPISGPLFCKKALELNEKLRGLADFKGQNVGAQWYSEKWDYFPQ